MKVQYVLAFVYSWFCLFPVDLSADDYSIEWADTIDTGNWDGAFDVAVDHSSNIIVLGSSFIGGNTDFFVVKYDSNGTILWLDTLDNGGEDYAEAVAVDSSNNIIVTGYSMINGDYDFYTVKYDPNGIIIWHDTLDNYGLYDIARGVAVDYAQNVIVTGYCDIGGDCVYFTVKYDPAGAVIWTDTLDNSIYDAAFDVAVDNTDNIIVTGYTSTGVNNDFFTVKYDSSGTLLWQDTIDICQYDYAYGVVVDNSQNILVTGCSGEALEDYDFFTVKYNADGTVLWADTLDHENNDNVAYDIAIDNNNNVYVTGYSLPLSSDYDFYTVKYDSNGTILWQGILDNGSNDIAYGIKVDNHNNIIVTGRSYIAGTFDHFTVKYAPITQIREHREGCFDYPSMEVSPNPFNDRTEITYHTGQHDRTVEMTIYDINGSVVRSFIVPTAYSLLPTTVSWDGTDNSGARLPSGMYYLMVEENEQRATKKLLLVR